MTEARSDEVDSTGRGRGLAQRHRWRRAAGWLGGLLVLYGLGRWLSVDAKQQLLNGLFLGSIYALIALGYTMVYGVLKLINFAHGEIFMVGAFIGYFTLSALRDSPWVAVGVSLLFAMVACALLGIAIERAAYRPLRRAPRLAALITAIGVSLLLQNLMMLIVGAAPKAVPSVIATSRIERLYELTHLTVNVPKLVALIASVILMLGLNVIVSKTKIGRGMRAVSEDREAAMMMGINVDLVISATFVIGSALAGAGGVLWGILFSSVNPLMGVVPGLKAFVAAVLGGIGSITGAMVGGLLIGVVEVLTSAVSSSPEQVTAAALFILLVVAFWRLGQARLRDLPHTPWGQVARVVGSLLVLGCCGLTAGVAAQGIAPHLTADPTATTLNGSTFKDAVVFAILIVILIVKPTGMMGRFAPEKV